MSSQWLDGAEVARFLADCPADLCDLILELREFVQKTTPEAHEAIKFNSLCYYLPDRPYGVIGGNICAIGVRHDSIHLGFIHGALLPDPDGLLQGSGKAKRHIEIRQDGDIRRRAFAKLIRAAVKYNPTTDSGT